MAWRLSLLRSMLSSPSCAELSGHARRVSGPRQDRTTARDSPPGPQNACTGSTGVVGASAEFVKSMCCTIRVEQGSRTRVPLCAGQARIEQQSKQIAKQGGQKQRLLLGESLTLTFTTSAAPFHCSIRDRSGCLGKQSWRPPAARIAQQGAAAKVAVDPPVAASRVPVFKNKTRGHPGT